ncbi:ABC transporter, membrane spanning protein (Ribose) [uncultured Pleomorphomonas sp.]|uniref:ABC transporter, membrane spanning protein (Ribose) n=1 Tax=uncultured Pleomorphomonas sp. TaxID=442121 RepID=A0A212LF84_9HYPH|nr:ABC transporter permease [uncultured Pleomorphomonas sp.]SCM76130.1 ABC transporter, membrane spanning protein (Ribose) [uncultured Pleomorphomonas sp.]
MTATFQPTPARARRGRPIAAILTAIAVAIYVGAALVTGQTSQLSFDGVVGLVQRTVALGLVALGQTFVILVASIDLSVAALISTVAVLASFLMNGDPAMMLPAVAACLALSALLGLANGLLVAYWGINSLIATLGTGLIVQGVLAAAFTYLPGAVAPSFLTLAYGGPFGVSWAILLFALLAIVAAFALNRTLFGARLFAVGGNPAGARLAGIRTERYVLAAHVACSTLAGVAGLYLAARLQSGTPWIGRDGIYDLESIAVVVIGGTALSGGRGGIGGTLAGVLLFACLDGAFNMLGVDAFLKQVLRGAVVIAAVAVHSVRNKGHVA